MPAEVPTGGPSASDEDGEETEHRTRLGDMHDAAKHLEARHSHARQSPEFCPRSWSAPSSLMSVKLLGLFPEHRPCTFHKGFFLSLSDNRSR